MLVGHVSQLPTLEGMPKTRKYICCSNNTLQLFLSDLQIEAGMKFHVILKHPRYSLTLISELIYFPIVLSGVLFLGVSIMINYLWHRQVECISITIFEMRLAQQFLCKWNYVYVFINFKHISIHWVVLLVIFN